MSAAILFLLIFTLYFVPSFIAKTREHPNATAIFALNLLLGWSLIGWVGALVWALTAINKPASAA